jgi:putative heme-binding domain-containing protein
MPDGACKIARRISHSGTREGPSSRWRIAQRARRARRSGPRGPTRVSIRETIASAMLPALFRRAALTRLAPSFHRSLARTEDDMPRRRRFLAGLTATLAFAGAATWMHARQQPAAPSPDRAQDQRAPAGSPFSTLPGFTVTRVTPADKTDSYIVVTFDSRGRPVVSQSVSAAGESPRILLDNDRDGIFEAEQIVSPLVNTCHGLFYDGTTLYANCMGRDVAQDGPPPPPGAPAAAQAPAAPGRGGRGNAQNLGIPGFYKLEDPDGDGVANTVTRLTRYVANGMGDHGPHAIRRGPDGSIMLITGNNTFIPDDRIDEATTPNMRNLKERQFLPAWRDPRFGNSTKEGMHGPLLRYEPASGKFSLLYTGLRNAYDFAFNAAGETFTFDSDMEWDVNAPWYRELSTRHMIPGGDGGYRNGTGKLQDEYFDVLPAIRYLRRGSPVGVETYESYTYPARFRDNLFEGDWSRGRLLYTALTPAGATYTGRSDLAELIHGEPMPITDVEVGPDGNLYFTTGGSAGTGGLYKLEWTGAKPAQPDMTGVLAIVRQPQPLSSWGWAAIEAAKARLGDRFTAELEQLARSTSAAGSDRARAILELQRHTSGASSALLRALANDASADVRAAVVFVAGMQSSADAKTIAAGRLRDASPFVQRRAAEALVRQGLTDAQPSVAPVADLYALLGSPDRFVRYAGRLALEHTPRGDWASRVMAETNVVAQTEGLLALVDTKTSEADLAPIFDRVVTLMQRTSLPTDQKTRVLRTFEVAATETASGVPAAVKTRVHDALIGQFPTPASLSATDTLVACQAHWPETTTAGCERTLWTHHMAKVLAYTGQPDAIDRILAVMPSGDADQPGQISFMYALRMIDTGWTPAQKQQITAWWAKASKWRGGATFAGHLNNIFDASIDVMTDAEKQAAYQAAPLFAPLTPDDVTLTAAAPGRGGRGGPQVPLDRQERYDNLVFPRGSGPGSLAGRGGAPNPTAGAETFQQSCASCHRFGTTGRPYGPDLTSIGSTMPRRDILRAVFFPDEKVDDKYRTTVVVTKDGKTTRGLVVEETARNVSLVTADGGDPIAIAKSDITSRTIERTSIMPSDLPDRIGDQNVANVVSFLMAGTR